MSNQFPYGNAFIVSTPYIDKATDRLYQEEKQRELYQQQQNKMLDDEFARNLSGIRDADINDLTKAYGEFKLANINTLKNKGNVSPKEQLEVLRKKAAVYDVINKSKQDKEWEEQQAKQIMTDRKGFYADDAHQQLIKRRSTPLSQIDRTKDENLMYKFSMPDLNKELKTARGEQKEVPVILGKSATDPMKDDKEIYKVGNNPNQYYNNLLSGIVASNKGRNFTGIINNKYNDAELENLKTRYYAKINDPKYISVFGKPEPFPESATNTDLGKAVAIQTMEEVVNQELKPIKKVSEINLGRVTDDRQRFAKEQQARYIAAGFTRQQRGFYHQDSKNEEEQKSTNIYIDGLVEDSINHSTAPVKVLPDGSTVRVVPFIPIVSQSFKVNDNTPISYRVLTGKSGTRVFTPIYKKYVPSPDGKYLVPTNEIDETLSKPMSESEFKTTMGYKMLSKKQQSEYGNQNYSTPTKAAAPTSSLNATQRRKK